MITETKPFNAIINFLTTAGVSFELEEHAPVITSAEAAAERGRPLSEGMKSLVVKVGQRFVLAIVPGDKRLDAKKLRQHLGERRLRFATAEEVERLMGCAIGACYPIGQVCNLPVYVDRSFLRNAAVAFNPGVHDRTIVMSWADFLEVAQPKLVDIAQ